MKLVANAHPASQSGRYSKHNYTLTHLVGRKKTSECHFLAHFLRFCIEKKVFSILRTKGFSCEWICKNITMKVTSMTRILMWFARSVSLQRHHVKDLNLSSPGLVKTKYILSALCNQRPLYKTAFELASEVLTMCWDLHTNG